MVGYLRLRALTTAWLQLRKQKLLNFVADTLCTCPISVEANTFTTDFQRKNFLYKAPALVAVFM